MRGAGTVGATAVIVLKPERHSEIRGFVERHHRDPDLTGQLGKYGADVVRSRTGRRQDARNISIERGRVDTEPGVDVVVDVPGVGVTRKLAGAPRSRVARIEVPNIALQQPFEPE